MTAARRLTAIILGAPGGGKGTISKKLVSDFDFKHISTGDLLRHQVAQKTDLGIQAKGFMSKGQFVPDELVLNMLYETIKANEKHSMLLDGFPRTINQAKSLESFCSIDLVIALDVPHETIIKRCSSRWVHAPSGRTYNTDYKQPKIPGKDDETGEALVQRDDDKPETVKARLEAFDQMSKPLFQYYSQKEGIKCKRFVGTESDVIYPHVKEFVLACFGQ